MANEVLIVEDNPILQRQLKKFLSEKGLKCISAGNENEARDMLNEGIFAVVADIDLSETGGEPDGGIRLARFMSEKGWKIPIILLSHTPWANFPILNSNPDYNAIIKEYNIHSIMDRNDRCFREELLNKLLEIYSRKMT